MRSKAQIEKELSEARECLETYERDVADYNGDGGAERYMFLTSSSQAIKVYTQKVQKLEEDLAQLSKTGSANSLI